MRTSAYRRDVVIGIVEQDVECLECAVVPSGIGFDNATGISDLRAAVAMLVVPLHAAQFDESAVHIARECSGAIFMQPRCELKLIRRLIACYRTICLRSRIRIIDRKSVV